MIPREIANRRIRSIIGMDKTRESCRSTDVRLPPNNAPILKTNPRLLRDQLFSYSTRTLPSVNPYALPGGQRVFKPLMTTTRKKIIKQHRLPSLEPVTICDLDEHFFSIIEGRVLKPSPDIHVYMNYIRNIFMDRATRGLITDRVISFQQNLTTEDELYQEVKTLFDASEKNFAKFLRDGYQLATEAQEREKEGARKLAEKEEELEVMTSTLVELRVALSAMRAECVTLVRYRKYLNRVSPLSFRELHDEDYISEKAQWNPRILKSIFFPRLDLNIEDDEEAVEMVVEPVLYFKTPDQIMKVFEQVEKQCLSYMRNIMRVDPIVKSFVRNRNKLRRRLDKEESNLKELITIYEEQVTSAEDNAVELERTARELMTNTIQELACSRETILLEFNVEFVHVRLLGESLGRSETFAMARAIEAVYLSLNTDLELLDSKTVRTAERLFFAEDARLTRQAHRARAQLLQWSDMRRSLYKAFKPPSTRLPRLHATSSCIIREL